MIQHLLTALPSCNTPLFDTATLRQIEAQALAQLAPHETNLMQRAGDSIARLTLACYPHAHRILIMAGKGNNGGDAIVAATLLHQKGRQVHLIWLGDTDHASHDTLQAVQAAQQSQLPLHPYSPDALTHLAAQHVDLIIDGLFGIGLSIKKSLDDDSKAIINFINQHPAPVIAIDTPSGLIAQNGSIHSHAVKANHTLTFLAAKPGLFTANGREYGGQIWLDTLDISPHNLVPCAHLFMPLYTPTYQGIPINHRTRRIAADSTITYGKAIQQNHMDYKNAARPQNTHKGSFGDVTIIGGAAGMVGAAILAGRAAIKAGAGKVYLALLANEQSPIPITLDDQHPELMFRPINQLSLKQSTLVCGCGGGTKIAPWLPQILQECPRLVLDADALNAIAESKALQQQLRARKFMELETILTPHPLEAARLLEISSDDIQNNRLYFAQTLADTFACTCVLKGSGSIIATPESTPYINSSGNAALATAGTGDVLAGWIAGSWSATHKLQKLNLHELTAQCVWEHGHAADRWQQQGNHGALPASELIHYL